MCNLPFFIASTNYGDVSAVQFAAVVFIIFLIMSGLLVGINLKEKLLPKPKPKREKQEVKVSPNPLNVELVKSLASTDEVKEIRTELRQDIKDLRQEMAEGDEKLHRRTGAMTIKLADVDGGLKEIKKMVGLLLRKEIGE